VTLSRRTLQGHFTQSVGGNSELATSGPENSSVFSSRQKVVSDDAARTADGRLPMTLLNHQKTGPQA